MNKISTLAVFILLFCSVPLGKMWAVGILHLAPIQASGSLTVKAIKIFPSSIVQWKATRYYIDETSGAYSYATDTASASGDSAQFSLQKAGGKYTYYKIFATEGVQDEDDSTLVQVLIAGVVQKYLFTDLSLSQYSIPVWVVLPSNYSAASKFVATMCGINRDASNIATFWVPFANANNYVIAAPEFSSKNWSSDAYILGNMFTGSNGTGNLNPKAKWTFNIVEQIHRELYINCGLKDSTYELWGHSAGGQFVHRLAFFLPDKLITRYIVGNSGWYTCPDLSVIFPWGAQNSQLNLTNTDLVTYTNQKLVIMRGTADTLRDGALNTEPLSDAQGLNRYTRAGYFYNTGVKVNSNLSWKLIDVPNVGHSDQLMAVAGGSYILANPTSIKNSDYAPPKVFSISNYPNPFNPSTRVVFSLDHPTWINITIYNLLGKKVTVIADEYLHTGTFTYEFNAGKLASGIYLCRITGEKINSTLKMELLK
jgi:hypothetical protein